MQRVFQSNDESDCSNDEERNRLFQPNCYQANSNNMAVTAWSGYHGSHPASMAAFAQHPPGLAFPSVPFPGPQHLAAQAQAPPSQAPIHHFHRSSSTASSISTATSRRDTLKNEETLLGPNFHPGPWHVICGRSKHNFDHIGNRRLRIIVANNLKAYVECPSRRDKTDLISRVADEIRLGCHGGGFVRKEKAGQWVEVGPTISREKVSHAFRDSLLKNTRRATSRSPTPVDQGDMNRQYNWKEAQNEIFSMLNLCSDPETAQNARPPMAGAVALSTTAAQSGNQLDAPGIAMLAGAAGTDMPPVQATAQLYANLYQSQEGATRPHAHRGPRPQQHQSQLVHSQSHSDESDQISENLAYGDAFPCN